jgi:hypothetical protein
MLMKRGTLARAAYDRFTTRVATALVLVVLTIALGAPTASPEPAPSGAAQPVSGVVVKVGPFRGMLARRYDVVDGRFRLHVGDVRDKATGLSQKIPWFVATRAGTGRSLLVTGTRLMPSRRTFRQRFGRAGYPGQEQERRYVYPSIIAPPAAGCWRLRFQSGKVDARVVVLVRND